MAKRIARRIMLIGWDAADWHFIQPMLEKGLLPNLQKLVARGVMGKIATLSPMLSPMLWNSIATGKLGHKHGILGFAEPDGKGASRPVTSTSRQAKALWNILSQNGLRSGVVNWFASHPAEKINGCVFSDRYSNTVGEKATHFPLDPAAIHPPELLEIAQELQVHPDGLDERVVLPFVPMVDKVDQDTDKRIGAVARLVAEATTVHNALTYLAENETWDLLAAYYDTIDHAGHGFMEFNPPKMDHVSDLDFEVYSGVMAMTYKYHDMMLGRLMDLAGEDTHIMVLSDHGFHHAEMRPKFFPHPTDPEKQIGPGTDPLAWHRSHGVFVLAGPGVKQDELVHGMTLLDVCPTILAMLGLPVGKDMDGVVMTQVFTEPLEVDYIDSHEPEQPNDGVFRGDYAEDPYAAAAAMKQLVELGYIEAPGEDQEKFLKKLDQERNSVLAQVYFSIRDFANAEKYLRLTIGDRDDAPELTARLVMTLMEQQRIPEAEAEIARYTREGRAMPLLTILRAQLRFMRGDFDGAHKLFQEAQEADPLAVGVHAYLGQIHLSKKRFPEAEQAFRKVIASDPDNAEAHDGLGSALASQGKFEDALFHHMQSAALSHHRWITHFNMALVLLELNRVDWAIRALETTIQLNPDFPGPHRILARVYRRRMNDTDSAMKHLRLLAEKRAKLNRRRKEARPESADAAWLATTAAGETGASRRFDENPLLATTRFDAPEAPTPQALEPETPPPGARESQGTK